MLQQWYCTCARLRVFWIHCRQAVFVPDMPSCNSQNQARRKLENWLVCYKVCCAFTKDRLNVSKSMDVVEARFRVRDVIDL